jgi:predicted nucleotide-binding protein
VSTTRFGDVHNQGDGNIVSQGNTGTENISVGTAAGRNRSGPQSAPAPAPAPADPSPIGPDRRRNVFVVHGRDEQARRAMFDLLRRLGLHPLEWESLVAATRKASPFLGEVVLGAPAQAQAAMVLLTPDDLVRLHPSLLKADDPDDERLLTGQPRPNVLLELGMVLMAYPERTVIVELGSLRRIADLAGLNVIRFDGSTASVGKIAQRLKVAGCPVNDGGSDWHDVSAFKRLDAYRRNRDS